MPKNYFQMIPSINYDIDGDGTTKVAIDVLRRIKPRIETFLEGAIFYNYQMQEGDNAEIIADKYYGSSQYHWVVLMMNNILDHTYDFSLDDANFERYIEAKYGSFERSYGVTKTLSSSDYLEADIFPQWYAYEQHRNTITLPDGFQEAGGKVEDYVDNLANTQLQGISTSGTIPAGNSTAIMIWDEITSDPFSNIYVGDVVYVFVPEDWYAKDDTTNYPKISYTAPSTVTGKATLRTGQYIDNKWQADTQNDTRIFMLSTDMNSNTFSDFAWVEDVETVQLKTGIHHFEMEIFANTSSYAVANTVYISQDAYVNSSIGTSERSSKKIVTNYEYEEKANEDKRNIVLLRKEYLHEFVKEFNLLMNSQI